jgi:DNA-binding transcriptional LysR family regulator
MELRHLRYFLAVAEEGTIVAAAARLGVAQPALTRQIHALERELDVTLLDRRPRGVALTPAGEVVLASARHVMKQVDAAVERARGSSHGIAGRCVVCTGARPLASGLIARILARLSAHFPGIELGVMEGTLDRQFHAIQKGEADLGIGVPAAAEFPDLASETIDFDILDAALLVEGHPLAERESISLAELAGDPFLTWAGGLATELRRQKWLAFGESGFTPAAVRQYHQVFALQAAVAAGQGWTLIPRGATALAPEGTRIVPLSDCKVPLPLALIWRVEERHPVVRTVMDVVRRVASDARLVREGTAARGQTPLSPTSIIPDPRRTSASALLELRHLRYFCAVVDAGTFGRAAEQLGLTQPALSRQVGDLERVVGVPVLDRAPRGVSATPAGESLYRGARRILDEVTSIAAETERARRGVIARCVVASVPTTSARRLVATLTRECAQAIPHVEVVLEDRATPTQPVALRRGHIDLGICHASPLSAADERGLERFHLTTDLVNCALVADDNPLAAKDRLTLNELSGMPFLFPDRDFQPALYDQLFATFTRLGFTPRVEAAYDGLQTIWALVAEDRGWGIGFASQCEMPPAGTVSVPIEDFSLPWGLDLLSRADESRSVILDVADRVRDIAAAMPATVTSGVAPTRT